MLHDHSPSYIHQDLKPENILLDDSERCLLTDFGSVRLADVDVVDRNQAIQIVDIASQHCTISYRSPELFDVVTGTKLDCRYIKKNILVN